MSVPERTEIDAEYKWRLESVFEDTDAWEAEYEVVRERIEALADREGRDHADGETLLETLELRDEVSRRVSTVAAFARMRSDQDTRNQEMQALSSRGRTLAAEASSAGSFVEPTVQSFTRGEVEEMVEATEGLEEYEHYLDDVLRMKPHTRSAEVEALLSDLGEVLGAPGEIYSRLTNADMTYPEVERPDGESVEITQSNLTTLLKHRDREFRREVHDAFYGELATVRNTVGTSLTNSVRTDVKLARARGYDSARQAAMDGPNVPVEVYDTLVDTVRANLDTLHRHLELKRSALGLDDLRPWDVYTPMVDSESPTVEYETACDHVVDAMAPLGEAYQDRVRAGLDDRWVDVYESRGKRTGAYSGGTYDTQPFILMNYQDDVASMFTLAHELGHSLHSEYTSEHQPYVYSDYEIFVAEVASTVNEALLTDHLLEVVEDDRFRRHVLDQYLERFRSTLYRQAMFADFEHRIHGVIEDDGALTPDRLDEQYRELKAEFHAPADLDDHIAREWMRIPHFYYGYYVYQYGTGISAAVALAEDVTAGEPGAAEDYVDFLTLGSREYPLELLRDAGVDMATAEPVERAVAAYDDALDEMAALLA